MGTVAILAQGVGGPLAKSSDGDADASSRRDM